MGKLFVVGAALVAAYLYLGQNPRMPHQLHLSGAAPSAFSPSPAQSIGAAAVGLAAKTGG